MLITNSRVSAFAKCPRFHDICYNRKIRPVEKSYPLRFGTMMHLALEAWWLNPENRMRAVQGTVATLVGNEEYDEWDLIKAIELMRGYDARWSSEDWETISVEKEFRLPLYDTHQLGGKIDVLARRNGQTFVVEHKTSSEDISPGSDYWKRLTLDSQVSTYIRAAKELGHAVDGCLYDVLLRPSINPLKATPSEKRKYTKTGQLYAKQRAEDESPDEYRLRLRQDIADNPDSYFQRGTVVRTEAEETESALDLQAWSEAIVRGGHAPKNPKACKTFGMTCSYLGVCSGVDSLEDPVKFRVAEEEHEELTQ